MSITICFTLRTRAEYFLPVFASVLPVINLSLEKNMGNQEVSYICN
jgi:hypothetical protein